MPETAGMDEPTKPAKSKMERFKSIRIPVLGRNKKKTLKEEEKQAAEFLGTQRGETHKAIDCGPESGVRVEVDEEKEQASFQVAIYQPGAGDGGGKPKADAPKIKNIKKHYARCFAAQKSYEATLKSFIEHETKKRGITEKNALADSDPAPADDAVAEAIDTDPFQELEANIARIETEIKARVEQLEDGEKERKDQRKEEWKIVKGLRSAFNGVARNARNIKTFVSLIPKSAGFGLGGLIVQGISLVLDSAARYSAMDKNMQRALIEIKNAMLAKAFQEKGCEPDRIMHRHISDLLASIFRILELLLQWVCHRGLGLVEAFFKPDTYGSDLHNLIATVKIQSTEMSAHGRSLEVRKLGKEMKQVKAMMKQSRKEQERQGKQVDAAKTTLDGQDRKLDRLLEARDSINGQDVASRKALEDKIVEATLEIESLKFQIDTVMRRAATAAMIGLVDMITQDLPQWRAIDYTPEPMRRLLPAPKSKPKAKTQRPKQQPPASSTAPMVQLGPAQQALRRVRTAAEAKVTASDVLDLFKFDASLVIQDADDVRRGTEAKLSTEDFRVLLAMINHVRLRALLEGLDSGVLFIKGGLGRQHLPRGPISVGAARVALALDKARDANPSVFALCFFCGENLGEDAAGLAMALLLQLIDQYRDLDTKLLRECRDAMLKCIDEPSGDDVSKLCGLLERCIGDLPAESTLFCVIDGIAFFQEPPERYEGAGLILEQLVELGSPLESEEETGRARVKCLFTTPAFSPDFEGLFEEYDVMNMQGVSHSGALRSSSWLM